MGEFDWLEGAINRSYQKGKGTKAEQVDAIAAGVRDMLRLYRPTCPVTGDTWIVSFVCGHDEEVPSDTIREHGIWPFCNTCQDVRGITRAGSLDDLFERER